MRFVRLSVDFLLEVTGFVVVVVVVAEAQRGIGEACIFRSCLWLTSCLNQIK